ncbi:MAG: cupin domain-containing protein [Calditrichia bacterium]
MIRKNLFKEKVTEEDFLKKITLFHNSDISVESYYFLPGQEFPLHRHPNGTQAIIIIRGEAEFYIKKEDEEIMTTIGRDGDVFFFESNTWHGAKNTGEAILIVAQVTTNEPGMETKGNI